MKKIFFPEKSPILVIIAISPIVAALLKQHVQLGRKIFHERNHLFSQHMENLQTRGLNLSEQVLSRLNTNPHP